MEIIPVIDVRNRVAVRAVGGDRARYRPLETSLAQSSDPVAVAMGFRSLFPFPKLYVADLDGIEGRGANADLDRQLVAAWPGSELWIDDGSVGVLRADVGIPPTLALPTRGRGPVRRGSHDRVPPPLWGRLGRGESRLAPMIKGHVLGSETLATLDDHERALRSAGGADILSLDFRGDGFLGPAGLLEDAVLWPERVIVMTLGRVGTDRGPDLDRLSEITGRAGRRKVYAAGGVRGPDDLLRIRDAGAAGALVASALHDGRIKAGDLEGIAGL